MVKIEEGKRWGKTTTLIFMKKEELADGICPCSATLSQTSVLNKYKNPVSLLIQF